MLRTLSLVLLSAALLACTKSDPPPPAPPPPASVTATVTASAPPAASTTQAAAPTTGDGGDCGSKENPCPLQAWMKENTNEAMAKADLPALAIALDKTVTLAPPGGGYPNWVSISKDGAAAARSGDKEAAKASCRTCHDQYKKKYQTEMRARKI